LSWGEGALIHLDETIGNNGQGVLKLGEGGVRHEYTECHMFTLLLWKFKENPGLARLVCIKGNILCVAQEVVALGGQSWL
jgi:hypothetical protein